MEIETAQQLLENGQDLRNITEGDIELQKQNEYSTTRITSLTDELSNTFGK